MSRRSTSTTRAAAVALLLGSLAACSSSGDGPDGDSGTSPAAGASSTSPVLSGDEDSGTGSELTDVATDPPPATASSGADDLDVVFSYLEVDPGGTAVEAAGQVSLIVDGGGTCTLVLSRSGEDDVRVEGEASVEPSSTACSLLSVPVDGLASGPWTARLEFRSATSSGSSPSQTVVIP